MNVTSPLFQKIKLHDLLYEQLVLSMFMMNIVFAFA